MTLSEIQKEILREKDKEYLDKNDMNKEFTNLSLYEIEVKQ